MTAGNSGGQRKPKSSWIWAEKLSLCDASSMTKFYSRRCPRRFRNSIPGSEKPSAPKRFRGFFVSHLSAGSKTARPCFSHRTKGFCRRQDPVFLPCVAGKKICFPSLLFLGSFGILLSISSVSLADAAHQFLLLLRPGAFSLSLFFAYKPPYFYKAGALAFILRLRPAAAGSPGFFPGPRTFPGDRQLPAYPYPFQTGAPPGPFWAQ